MFTNLELWQGRAGEFLLNDVEALHERVDSTDQQDDERGGYLSRLNVIYPDEIDVNKHYSQSNVD